VQVRKPEYTGMNPDFFKGTMMEDAIDALKAERAVLAAE
jgi:hypothetical protein